MNQDTARELRRYAKVVVPPVARERFPGMVDRMYRLLKWWWNSKCSSTDRAVLRQSAKLNMPLPDEIKREARSRGLIVEWPPKRQGG